MRDTRSLALLLVSLLLVLVSFVLVWTWGYSFYTKSKDVNDTGTASNSPSSNANPVQDSLEKIYTATLNDLDIQLDSTITYTNSLKTELDIKLVEFYRLRNEIATILENRNDNTNFAIAKQKIGELQSKVEDLKEKNLQVETENKKLNEVLNQITNTKSDADKKNVKATGAGKNNMGEKPVAPYPVFTASELKLAAMINSQEKEAETTVAAKTEKLNGSFTVVNFNSQLNNAEIIVVVQRPDGGVMKNSGWDSGTFYTPEGKKVYSYKFNFNYTKGESRRLLFSLRADHLNKGNYSMEIYQNGLLIGRTIKTLS